MSRNNDCTTGNLLDYEYFSKHYKLIPIDLRRQIELENPDLKQQINFIMLKDKAFEIANNPKYDAYQRGLVSMVYKFFDKKSKGSCLKQNQQLATELHKPAITKVKKRKVYSSFKGNIWGVDLADMQLTSKYNKGIRCLLCAIHLFSKILLLFP